ncbi:FAD-binding protein [Celeribacter litoreus]|uniref:FAD-binding protein n=1 Tax=Celeribacter litoreus TaxID=2876714 RepID=UPI001CC94D29|nr:FAD-binding protein [Celeribacter litoreus]MCA0044510.1 FAD-binding protein [Celeribacter litoreus]
MSILAKKKTEFRDARDALAETIRSGGPFALSGNGTSRIGLCFGAELKAPTEGWDYDPSALTLTVAAGVPVAVIEQFLRDENQRLAFEPPRMQGLLDRDGASTIGGVVAGNLSGPRRVAVGACRDFCLGVEFVDGRGEVVKNGGRVMKNVTGLDLVKLMAGSNGTLGLITEVSLKTQPIPECVATLVIEGLTEVAAISAMSAALGTPFDVSGVAHLRGADDGEGAKTFIRLEGFENSVKARIAKLQSVLKSFGESDVEWHAEKNSAIWQGIRDVERFCHSADDVWRVSVKPSEAVALVEAVAPEDVIYDWGGNRLWLITKAGTDVRAKVTSGHATLVRASAETKQRLGVFAPQSQGVAKLSEGLRRKFDPDAKFNRGMMG